MKQSINQSTIIPYILPCSSSLQANSYRSLSCNWKESSQYYRCKNRLEKSHPNSEMQGSPKALLYRLKAQCPYVPQVSLTNLKEIKDTV